MNSRLNRLPRASLRSQVATAIRDAIIEGQFRPGEKIPEQELAEQLGVSRTPVREAVRILEQQGLVEIRPKAGTFIATLDWEEAYDSLSVRAVLEQLAIQQTMERLGPEEWNELCNKLQAVSEQMLDAVVQGRSVRANELDIEWHTLLVDAARNQALSRTWRTTGSALLVWSPEREIYPLSKEKLALLYQRHKELLTTLRARQPVDCKKAIKDHIFVKFDDIREWQEEGSLEKVPVKETEV